MRPDEYDKLANKLLPFILAKVRQASRVTPAAVSGDMSAYEIMAAVQSLDGAGSGLDADTVDGEHAAGFVLASTLDANSVLYATTDNTPGALSVGASTIVGRKAAGDVVALSASEGRTVLGLGTMAVEAAADYVARKAPTYAYVAKTDSYTLDATDAVVALSVATKTLTLPTAVGCTGRRYTLKATQATGTISVDGDGAETIDGLAAQTLYPGDCMEVVSNGAGWEII